MSAHLSKIISVYIHVYVGVHVDTQDIQNATGLCYNCMGNMLKYLMHN